MEVRNRIVEIKDVPGNLIRPNPKNWRLHPEGQKSALMGILAEVGVVDVLKVVPHPSEPGAYMLIDGHARAEILGDQPVKVAVLDLSATEQKLVLATFDPIGALADKDQDMLDSLIKDLKVDGIDLSDLGWSGEDLLDLLPGSGTTGMGRVTTLKAKSTTKTLKTKLNTSPARTAITSGRNKRPYLEVLEEAWIQSQAPRAPDAPTVISTFAGGGGSSLGYHMAGYRELLAVEWDDNAVQTLRLNFPHLDIYHGDIAKLSVDEVLKRTGLEPGQLDVFDGSPPCQGFSTAGKRDMGDERNQLFREYVRLLRGLRPKCFVMENVSGMVKGKMKLIFVEILRELKASGYKVSARLLNAMHYGVPQSRERMIFIGVRDDLGIEPSHPVGSNALITLRNALSGLSETVQDTASCHLWIDEQARKTKMSTVIHKIQPGCRTRATGQYVRLEWDIVSPTITKPGMDGLSPYLANMHCHPSQDRTLSIREMARVASFCDVFMFVEPLKHGASRIGNSVPPLLMRAVAGHIRDKILTPSSIE